MAEIDRLELQVEAQATKANQQLDKLITKLNSVSSSLGKINASGLTGLANGVQKLAGSMQSMNGVKTSDFSKIANGISKLGSIDAAKINSASSSISIMGKAVNTLNSTLSTNGISQFATAMQSMNGVKTSSFTRLAKNLEKIGSVNTTGINSASSAIVYMSKAFTNLDAVSTSAVQISEIAKNIAKLGNKSVTNAIANIPKLSSALNDMMRQLSKTPAVSSNLIKMTNALAGLAAQGSKVGTATKSMRSGLDGYSSSAKRASKNTLGLAAAFGKFYASFWVVQRALKSLFSSVESSMDYLETLNYFDVVVNKIGKEAASNWESQGYDSAQAYYDSFRTRMTDLTAKMTGLQINADGTTVELNNKNLGLDPEPILNYQATFAQMANSMGLLEDTALNVSTAFTMLGADWASLKNLDMDVAMQKFASALAGEIEPVRSLGIDISQTTLQLYAMKYGISENVSEMSQAAKIQLRLLAILDQSKVAMGDMANTLQSPSNQLRVLRQNFASLARIIGNMFLPIVAKVLPYINGLVIALRRLFTWLSGLMGIDISKLSTSIGDTSLDVSGLSDSTDDVSSGLADTAKEAEKLKNITTGIDELNIVSQDSSSDSDSSTDTSEGGYGVLDDAIAAALADYQAAWDEAFANMENKAEGIADKIQAAFKKIYDIAEPTRLAVKKLWDEGLSLFGNFVWTGLEDFWNDFLVPLGKWVLGEGLPKFLNITNELLKSIDWNKINAALKNFWKALEPFAESVGRGILRFYEDLAKIGAPFINVVVPGALNGIAGALNNMNAQDIEDIAYALTALFTALTLFKGISKIAGLFKTLGTGLLTLTGLSGMTLTIPNIALALTKFGSVTIGAPGFDMIGNAIMDGLWGAVKDLIPDWVAKLMGGIGAGAVAGGVLGSWVPGIGTAIGAIIGAVVGALGSIDIDGKSILHHIFDPIFNWDATKAIWEDAKVNFKKGGLYIIAGVLEGILAAIGLVLEPIGDFFVAIFDGFCAIFGIHSPATEMKPIGKYIVLGILEGITNTWTEFTTFLAGLPQKAVDAFGNIKTLFVTKGNNIVEGIQEGWNNLASGFATWLNQKRESIVTNFGSYWNNFVTRGNDIINGIKQGWNDLASSFAVWLGQKRESVVTNFGSYWNKFVTKGNDIINAIKQGWDDLSSAFATWLAQKRESVVTNFGSYWNNFVDKGKEIINGIKQGWNDLANSFSGWLSDRRDNVVSWFGGLKDSFTSKGEEIISGIKKGWNDNWSSFKDWLSGLPDKILSGIGSMYNKGKDLISDFIKGFKSISMPKFKIDISYDDKDDSLIGKMWKTLGFAGTPHFGWSFYANGGLPNVGEAFIARENGPEMVGRIGNKSAVANNDQITTAITNAVVQGMQNAGSSGSSDALLREQNELLRQILAKDTDVNLNGRKVNEELDNVKKSNGFSFAT